jgi:hypothetical protein
MLELISQKLAAEPYKDLKVMNTGHVMVMERNY